MHEKIKTVSVTTPIVTAESGVNIQCSGAMKKIISSGSNYLITIVSFLAPRTCKTLQSLFYFDFTKPAFGASVLIKPSEFY
jgi:hypothetical protein